MGGNESCRVVVNDDDDVFQWLSLCVYYVLCVYVCVVQDEKHGETERKCGEKVSVYRCVHNTKDVGMGAQHVGLLAWACVCFTQIIIIIKFGAMMAWIQFCLNTIPSTIDGIRRMKMELQLDRYVCIASHKIKMDAVLISMIIIILVHALFFFLVAHTHTCALNQSGCAYGTLSWKYAHFDLIMRCRTFVLFYIITYSCQTHNRASKIFT